MGSVVLIDSESSEVFIYLKRYSMAVLIFSNAIYTSKEEDGRRLRS
jgi:hypothetical protein